MPPEVKEKPARVERSRSTEVLDCKLTEDEILKYGRDLASVQQDLIDEEKRQEGLKQEMKSRLATLSSKSTELTTKVNRGRELRPVQVESVRDYGTRMYTQVCLDTGEIIKERPLTAEELQRELPTGGNGGRK